MSSLDRTHGVVSIYSWIRLPQDAQKGGRGGSAGIFAWIPANRKGPAPGLERAYDRFLALIQDVLSDFPTLEVNSWCYRQPGSVFWAGCLAC